MVPESAVDVECKTIERLYRARMQPSHVVSTPYPLDQPIMLLTLQTFSVALCSLTKG